MDKDTRVPSAQAPTGATGSVRSALGAGESAPLDITVRDIALSWQPDQGACTFAGAPMVMMWIDSTLKAYISSMESMVGPKRLALAMLREGRDSIDDDWSVIGKAPSFSDGFAAISHIAGVAGWGVWRLVSLDFATKRACFRVWNSWESRVHQAGAEKWATPFVAGKLAGYCSRLFATNCWPVQTKQASSADDFYEFTVSESNLTIEAELEGMLSTDQATRADMAVALQNLQDEIKVRQNAEKRLSAAMNAANDANLAKDEFLANMSHEIRTPMTAILGFTDLVLQSSELSATNRRYLGTVQRSGQNLLRLINDILDLSKIEARKLELNIVELELAPFLEDIRSLFELRVAEKRLELAILCQGAVPIKLKTDPLRLRQVLVNIVGNAVKFTEQGGVKIILDSAMREARQYLRIRVQDTGVGIPPSRFATLFQPFSPGEHSLTKAYEGSGLGLAISKRLIDLLGGAVEVESQERQGCIFTVWVDSGMPPVTAEAAITAEAAKVVMPKPPDPANQKLRGRVLIVEDVRDNQYLIAAYLDHYGLSYDFASTGLEALEKVSDGQAAYDLILMDIQMPIMDGLTATRHMRAKGHKVPIIALTAFAMNDDRQRCESAGCDGYLTKPIDRGTLQQVLAKHLPAVDLLN